MEENKSSCDFNPLRIIEDEIPSKELSHDKSDDDNESNGELFDFSSSDSEELKRVEVEGESEPKRNSLQIIEEKDLNMDETDNSKNSHRLSLQIDSGDDNSLVMTNDETNRTIIKIGSDRSSIDFGEVHESKVEMPNEVFNQAMATNKRGSHSENTPDDDGEAIVNILGQINDIVGYNKTV